MNILHTIVSVGPKSFGVGPVAVNLTKEQIRLGINAKIWCLDSQKIVKWATSTYELNEFTIKNFRSGVPNGAGFSIQMEKQARGRVSGDIDVIHQHGIWTGISRVTNVFRKIHCTPTIITLHGSLERWALERSKWKKQIALLLYEKQNFKDVTCFHACSEQEVASIRDYGLKQPIAVIPNGISKNWINSTGDPERFRNKYKISSDKRIFLFLSRVTPIKGLPMLIEAMNMVRHKLNNWILIIAGSDEFDHRSEVETLIKKMQFEKKVKFVDLLLGQDKRDAFAAAEFFVLPTKREAAPLVVLEALGAKLPVLTTKGAPWESLNQKKCGWWTDINPGSIADSLSISLKLSTKQLNKMGESGKIFVESEFIWDKSAEKTIQLYEWMLGNKDKPKFVITD